LASLYEEKILKYLNSDKFFINNTGPKTHKSFATVAKHNIREISFAPVEK